jgi:cell division protein FtsL
MAAQPRPARAPKESSKTYNAVAEAVGSLRQYQDVPQRLRTQWITAFLAVIVLMGIIAGLYLNVASRSAITGREIQSLQRLITENQGRNADLQTQLASLLSSEYLKQRAIAEGYTPLEGTNLDYIVVDGYYRQEGITLVTPAPESEDLSVAPAYTESLFTWLNRQIEAASLPLAQER